MLLTPYHTTIDTRSARRFEYSGLVAGVEVQECLLWATQGYSLLRLPIARPAVGLRTPREGGIGCAHMHMHT